jgi:hypothetical protein
MEWNLKSWIGKTWIRLAAASRRLVFRVGLLFTRLFWVTFWRASIALARKFPALLVRIGEWRLRSVLKWALLLAAAGFLLLAGATLVALRLPSRQVAMHAPVQDIVYLDQGWGPTRSSEDRQKYYYTPQGTTVLGIGLRYSWLVHLEGVANSDRFIAPDHMRALGFTVDGEPTAMNPDQLPVGFTRHYDRQLREDVVDLSCAVCHTGELHVTRDGQNLAVRIDGGQAMHAVTSTRLGQFGPTLIAAMGATALDPFRFNRFARGVLGDDYASGKNALWRQFTKVWLQFIGSAIRDRWLNLYPVEEGFGRTDAIGRISNFVFGTELDHHNYMQANAPVSYPAIWDAPRFDWVQYAGSVSQPMARNLGESLGVGATMAETDEYGRPLPADQQFTSTSLISNLHQIEGVISRLKPPEWPEEVLGKIDPVKRDRGRALFQQHCAYCHEGCTETPQQMSIDRPLQDPKQPLWHVTLVPVQEVGTDPQAALNFFSVRVDLSKAGIDRELMVAEIRKILETRKERMVKVYGPHSSDELECEIQQQLDAVNLQSASIGAALNFFDILLTRRAYKDLGLTDLQKQEYDGGGALDTPQVMLQYKARPLQGVWATGPYLHNGSVPTLYEMLLPASERTAKFFITSQMDFDPVRVGLAGPPVSTKGFWLDTSIPGNRNIGHEFRAGFSGAPANGVIGPELRDAERWDIIEFLKSYQEPPPLCKAWPPPTPPAACRGRTN